MELKLKNTNSPYKHLCLEHILSYKCDDVIDGFMKSFSVSNTESQEIFKEMLRWIWYCNSPQSVGYRSIDSSILIIDEMWHTFILYTKEYHNFCHEYLGYYLHHSPTKKSDAIEFKKQTRKEVLEIKKTQYELVYDLLGKNVFINWYQTYPEKYSAKNILSMRIK